MLLVSNHASYVDPVLLGVAAHRSLHYLAKEDLFGKNRFYTWLMYSLNTHPIRRNSADMRALKVGLDILNQGGVLTMFPEGTRSVDGRLGRAKEGVGWLALNSPCKVIPAYIYGSGAAWPKGAKTFKIGKKVHAYFGSPVKLDDLKGEAASKAAYHTATQRIMQAIQELKDPAEK